MHTTCLRTLAWIRLQEILRKKKALHLHAIAGCVFNSWGVNSIFKPSVVAKEAAIVSCRNISKPALNKADETAALYGGEIQAGNGRFGSLDEYDEEEFDDESELVEDCG